MSDVTRILSGIKQGDPEAAGRFWPLVYGELRRLAAQKLAAEKPGQTLQATSLVHEAYLRLMPDRGGEPGGDQSRWRCRAHFFAAAAEAMRRILVDQARRKHSVKRGGGRGRLPLDGAATLAAPEGAAQEDLLALDEALRELEAEEVGAAPPPGLVSAWFVARVRHEPQVSFVNQTGGLQGLAWLLCG